MRIIFQKLMAKAGTLAANLTGFSNHIRTMSTAINFETLPDEEKRSLLKSYDNILSDCDGVLWIGGSALPGAVTVMNTLKGSGKNTYFVTNNSTQTRDEFVVKCKRLGFNASKDDIISTAWLTAHYLKSRGFDKKVYIVGPKSVHRELQDVGIEAFGVGADPVPGRGPSSLGEIEIQVSEKDNVGAVVVGYDIHFSVPKMVKACTYLKSPDCLFIATNTDENYPTRTNMVLPGTGTFVRAVETGAGREAVIMGKPSNYILEAVLHNRGLDPAKSLMIGDRCNTDIWFGKQCGMATLLVLTGVTQKEQLENYMADENSSHLVPTYYTSGIEDLLPYLDEE